MSLAPILLFVYNRPDHVRRGIQSLLTNALAQHSQLYVFSDGAPNPSQQAAVDEVRQYVGQLQGFQQVHLIARSENWGLARNIIEGVSEVIAQHGRVIVLEDDLVVAPHFLQFMNDALETYKDEPRVGHIQACDFTNNPTLPHTFLIKWTGSWGWATWQRAWAHFNPNGSQLLQQLEQRALTSTFDFNNHYGFTRMLRRQIAGINNSWAIRWNASLFLADMLSLNVGRSLVSNIGLDGSGSNSVKGDPYTSELWMQPLPVTPITPVEENLHARKVFEAYYARTNNLWARAKRRLWRLLRRFSS